MRLFGFASRKTVNAEIQAALAKKEAEIQAAGFTFDPFSFINDIGIPKNSTSEYNKYQNYYKAVAAIYLKYYNVADYGNQFVKTIIDYRSQWILGKVPTFSAEGTREQEFINQFVKNNKWDAGKLMEFARIGEMEGRVLSVLMVKPANPGEAPQIYTRFFRYLSCKYFPTINIFDEIEKVTYYPENSLTPEIINPDRFELCIFSGATSDILAGILTPARISHILTNIDDVDRGQRDMRQINNIFASPVPFANVETDADAQKLQSFIEKTKWKIGQMLIGVKTAFSMVTADMKGFDSLKAEMMMNIQRISGHTGVPIFLLGFPELLSNRSTAVEMAESINATTQFERMSSEGSLEAILEKAMLLHNRLTGDFLDPSTIKVTIPEVSIAQAQAILTNLNLMRAQGTISLETYLEKNPIIQNAKLELERIQNEGSAQSKNILSLIDQGKTQ